MNQWDPKANEIFVSAMEIDEEQERQRFLSSACQGDDKLLQQVHSLIAAADQAGSFLEYPSETLTKTAAENVGTVIGPYKIREQLGEGGMGIVYAAEQEHPVRRKVALKIIKPGMDSREVISRFEAERQALAMMDHQNIARVLDAGTTESGLPYFVMELVRGVTVTNYCDKSKLSIRDRLELFTQICKAVQHAHQKGIIHRDIKPSNVMITLHDGVPVPKVIDFGVAKAINQRLTEGTVYTKVAQMLGTPAYMSPEQAELSGLDIDTRSDIYSLGVMLYELLTGSTPFTKEQLSNASFDEMRRVIREDQPPRPSDRVSTLKAEMISTVSGRNETTPERLSSQLKGELDWIVMKALEKDRTRRYETANAFADDIERMLRDEPVVARSPSKVYRLRKFSKRNATPIGIAASITILVFLFGVASLMQNLKLQKALVDKHDAELESRASLQRQEAFSDFLFKGVVDAANPETGDINATVRHALLQAMNRIDSTFNDEPEINAWVNYELGRYFLSISEYDEAYELLGQAFEWQASNLEKGHKHTLQSAHEFARATAALTDINGAIDIQRMVYDARLKNDGLKSQETLDDLIYLATLLLATDPVEAESKFNRAYSVARDIGLPVQQVNAEVGVAAALRTMSRFNEAIDSLQHARTALLAIDSEDFERHGRNHLLMLSEIDRDVVDCQMKMGNVGSAIETLKKCLEVQKAIYGPTHNEILTTLNRLALAHDQLGQHAQFEAVQRDCVKLASELYDQNHTAPLVQARNLVYSLTRNGKLTEAKTTAGQWLARSIDATGVTSHWTLDFKEMIANISSAQGDYDHAIEQFDDVIVGRLELGKALPSESPTRPLNDLILGGIFCNRGNALSRLSKYDLAIESYDAAIEKLEPLALQGFRRNATVYYFNSLKARGRAKISAGHPMDAVEDFNLAKALDVGRESRVIAEFEIARAQVASGKIDAAVNHLETILGEASDESAIHHLMAAKIYALMCGRAVEGQSPGSDNQNKFADKALRSLEEYQLRGGFDGKSSTQTNEIESDADFASIQNMSAFTAIFDGVRNSSHDSRDGQIAVDDPEH